MTSSVTIILTGHLGEDPRTFHTPAGDGVELRLAVEVPRRRDDSESVTRWVKVTAYGLLADRTARSVRKGDRVTVTGSDLMAEAWADKKTGEPRSGLKVLAADIAASMARDTVTTGYAARRAQQLAAAAGQPSDLPAHEQAEARVLSGVTRDGS
jgi:single-stranded DNA-binding protein